VSAPVVSVAGFSDGTDAVATPVAGTSGQ
jgi:hypothetical protein